MEKSFLNCVQNLPWKCDIEIWEIKNLAQKVFNKLKSGATKNKHYLRIFGISGCGKTSQLLPCVLSVCEKENIKPIHLAVRLFAKFHPKYKEFKKTCAKNLMREKTNGFAVRLLCFVFCLCVQKGFDIVLETTLLGKLESEFLKNLNNFGYKRNYFAISISKKTSIKSTKNRQENRIVKKSSINKFCKLEKVGFAVLSKHESSPIALWSFFDKKPIFCGQFCLCKNCFYKAKNGGKFQDAQKMFEAKKEFFESFKLNQQI